jgi:hypothetical protein
MPRRRSLSSSIPPPFTSTDEIPLLCYTREIARFCQCRLPTVWRLIRAGDFSRFPPPANSDPYIWFKADLLDFLTQPKLDFQPTGLRPLRRRA